MASKGQSTGKAPFPRVWIQMRLRPYAAPKPCPRYIAWCWGEVPRVLILDKSPPVGNPVHGINGDFLLGIWDCPLVT